MIHGVQSNVLTWGLGELALELSQCVHVCTHNNALRFEGRAEGAEWEYINKRSNSQSIHTYKKRFFTQTRISLV